MSEKPPDNVPAPEGWPGPLIFRPSIYKLVWPLITSVIFVLLTFMLSFQEELGRWGTLGCVALFSVLIILYSYALLFRSKRWIQLTADGIETKRYFLKSKSYNWSDISEIRNYDISINILFSMPHATLILNKKNHSISASVSKDSKHSVDNYHFPTFDMRDSWGLVLSALFYFRTIERMRRGGAMRPEQLQFQLMPRAGKLRQTVHDWFGYAKQISQKQTDA